MFSFRVLFFINLVSFLDHHIMCYTFVGHQVLLFSFSFGFTLKHTNVLHVSVRFRKNVIL